MSKRNLLTLVVILALIGIAVLSYFFEPIKLLFPGKSSHQTASFDEGRIEFKLQIKKASTLTQENEHITFEIEKGLSSEGLVDFKVSLPGDKIEITAKDDWASSVTIVDTLSKFQNRLQWKNPIPGEGKVTYLLEWKESAWKELEKQIIYQCKEALEKRLSNFDFDYFIVDYRVYNSSSQPDDIIVITPLVEDRKALRNILTTGGYLEFTEVIGDPASTEEWLLEQFDGKLPEKTWIGREKALNEERYYLLKSIPVITGKGLLDAKLSQDAYNNPAVSFNLDKDTAELFNKYTGENVGKRLAIVLDKKVISAPIIQARIADSGIITGNFTAEEARTLALLLQTGALPAELEIVSEKSIKP